MDDIKVKFHPKANIPDQIYSFDDYSQAESTPLNGSSFEPVVNTTDGRPPWYPFNTRTDFELAELMVDAHLNNSQVKALLSIIGQVSQNGSLFTLTDLKDLNERWEIARRSKANTVSIGIIFHLFHSS